MITGGVRLLHESRGGAWARPREGFGRARDRDRREDAGQVPVWIPFFLVFAFGAWLVASLEGDLDLSGYTRIDPRRTRITEIPAFADVRWREALSVRLAELPPAPALDPRATDAIRGALASLPFVAEVGEGRVVWPDGCEVRVRFREPAACVQVGDRYLAVSKDGVLLPGEWTRPPWVAGGWLPVLLLPKGALDAPRPGGRLAAGEPRDALAVAVSMRASLAAEDFETMGAPGIDASHARSASVDDPGVVLRLEGGRTVYFGRAPGSGEPGELPEANKWESLRRGLKALRATTADAREWDLLDVRWDVPDVLWRDATSTEADAAEAGQRARED